VHKEDHQKFFSKDIANQGGNDVLQVGIFQENNNGTTIIPYVGDNTFLAKWVANERL
jgi:hypothetical protein